MTTLKQCMAVCMVASFLVVPSFAQPGAAGNGDVDRVQQQDGTCDNPVCIGEGTGAQQRGMGRGRGWGRQMAWRAAQQDRLNQQALAMGSLSEAEVADVLYMREEEKLARDVYITLYETWLADVFDTISVSEQRHMDALGRIIEAQGLTDPVTDDTVGAFTDPTFTKLFTELTTTGKASCIDALKAGAYIEELDIFDLMLSLSETENAYLAQVLENLKRGSGNHLRAFVTHLAAAGETYSPQVLTQEQFDEIIGGSVERGGPGGRQ